MHSVLLPTARVFFSIDVQVRNLKTFDDLSVIYTKRCSETVSPDDRNKEFLRRQDSITFFAVNVHRLHEPGAETLEKYKRNSVTILSVVLFRK